jgi:3-hydroxyacyl-[acyl-carrier-protein] dehydratase
MKDKPMLLNELFSIKDVREDTAGTSVTMLIELDPGHAIFEGHFPGNPVLPGACTVQIIKELLDHHLSRNLVLKKAGMIKYLAFINPEKNNMIYIDLLLKDAGKGIWICNATVYFEATVFCSLKGEWAEK